MLKMSPTQKSATLAILIKVLRKDGAIQIISWKGANILWKNSDSRAKNPETASTNRTFLKTTSVESIWQK